MPGSLVFGAAASDHVDDGAVAQDANLDPFTVALLCYPTTFTTQRMLWSKGLGANRTIRLSGTGGFLECRVAATVTHAYTTNSGALTLNAWNVIVVTFDSSAAAGQKFVVYTALLGAPVAACTFSVTTDGSGPPSDDTVGNTQWGNNSIATVAFQGRIACGGRYAGLFTQADADSWRMMPRATVRTLTAKSFKRFGKDGADAIDYVGNANGTVAGATQGDGPPLIYPYAFDDDTVDTFNQRIA